MDRLSVCKFLDPLLQKPEFLPPQTATHWERTSPLHPTPQRLRHLVPRAYTALDLAYGASSSACLLSF